MAPTKHSTFSASSSARLLACPGSYQRALDADDGIRRSSVYSAQGTLGHSLAEVCVQTGRDVIDYLGQSFTADGFSFTVDEEFAEAAQVYVDTLRALRGMGYVLALEIVVTPQVHWGGLAPLPIDLFGTCDCVAYNPATKHLMIVDLKFGAGVPVDVQGNTQTLYYASGAAHPSVLAPMCARAGVAFNGVDKVETIIVQPRAYHRDGPVRSATYTYDEVVDWARITLYLGVERALNDKGRTLDAGKHCRFCPVLAHCAKPKDTAVEAARAAFLGAPVENLPDPEQAAQQSGGLVSALPANQLSDDDLAAILDKIETIQPWLKAVRELALARAEAGRDIPGWKAVPKRALRVWDVDADKLREEMDRLGVPPETYLETALRSPAQVEKRMGRKHYAQHAAQFVTRQSSGLTLAPEGDPRRRTVARLTGADVFGPKSAGTP